MFDGRDWKCLLRARSDILVRMKKDRNGGSVSSWIRDMRCDYKMWVGRDWKRLLVQSSILEVAKGNG
jgi:hypothetical protein